MRDWLRRFSHRSAGSPSPGTACAACGSFATKPASRQIQNFGIRLSRRSGESEHFLLLACPASAKSRWVQQEVQWWLQHRSVENLLIVLTDGEILWDAAAKDFDWGKTTALPSCLKGVLPGEPLYADFRAAKSSGRFLDPDKDYRSALLDIAAPLLGRPKDDLDSEDLRLHRKAEWTAWAVAAFVVVLGLAAGVAMNAAYQRQKTAASRALASEASSHLDDRSLALLLSLESRHIADTVESKRALLAALQRAPHAETFLWGHTDAVTRAVFSPDGQTILSAGGMTASFCGMFLRVKRSGNPLPRQRDWSA